MKIKIELEGLTLEQATGLTNYLSGITPAQAILSGSTERPPVPEYVQELRSVNLTEKGEEAAQDKPKATRKKAEKVEAPQEDIPTETETPQEEETKTEEIEVKEPETVSAPTLMQIRSLVAQKAADHKDAIKAKLVELGAQNVSTLDAKHFPTIFDFLNAL